ncbi:MFS transporter [Herbaspirillum sp. RV1423]|uniref:MFS transporter n=1 Tax=Herbaspirillum sp. RV1423 TaxID=1443993 RepID=UPI0004AD5457|nr:MFS transporter [Herbaspirillum sp. RV1423]
MKTDFFSQSIALLRTRRFGTFFFATLLSNIGTWTQQVAQPWLLLSLGASSFVVGLDAFAMGAPVWLLTLLGGVLADRADRRFVIALFQSIQMLCPILLVVLLLTDAVEPWIVVVLSLVVGITDALSMPSFQSIVPSIVERKQIATGLALNATQFNLSRIIGPAIAGVLMAGIGAIGCFAVSAFSYVPFIVVALWILPRKIVARQAAEDFDRRHLFAGVRDIAHQPYLRGALLTVLTTSLLCGPLITFCPILVKEIFHEDASQFSLAIGSFGVGALIGAIFLLSVDPARDRRHLSTIAASSYGLILVLVAVNPWITVLPVLLGCAGLAMCVGNTSANSLLQAMAPARLRGQTVALFMLAMRGGVSLGSLITGVSISFLGVRDALLLNGVIALLAHLAIGRQWLRLKVPAME